MVFTEAALRYMGYPLDYAYLMDKGWKGTDADLIRVAAILLEDDPEVSYSLDEIRTYAVILMLVRGICTQLDDQSDYLDQMLGMDEEDMEDDHLFCPDMVVPNSIGKKPDHKAAQIAPTVTRQVSETKKETKTNSSIIRFPAIGRRTILSFTNIGIIRLPLFLSEIESSHSIK